MKKEIICTVCPMGCHIFVEGEGEKIVSIDGYTCKRGEAYAAAEFAHPVRILTTTVKTDSKKTPIVPVRSDKPLPKEKIGDCMEIIRQCQARTPIRRYDVLIEDICGTGVNIVATGEIEAQP